MSIIDTIPETSLVLVAIIPNQRDLDIARLLGWYRIPLKTAPKVISVDYLALYQGGSFPEAERSKIHWLAPIIGHELTTRAELFHDQSDHPRAQEEYFKLQLGPLIELPNPIVANTWKRITFFYTTMGRIRTAATLQDLPVHDEERQVLWQSLRERALQADEYHAQELPKMAIDPALLALFDGLMDLN